MMVYRYSEIFKSIQGEGKHTGIPSVFVRFWGCNFKCPGFSNDGNNGIGFDPSEFIELNDLPVIEHGCDSRYSWAVEFQHLSRQETAETICGQIVDEFGPYQHPDSKQWSHLVITGGEPMLSQRAMTEIINLFNKRHNLPNYVTVETNGTQLPREPFISTLQRLYSNDETEWLWSVSLKLSLSGEVWSDAIKPDVVATYASLSDVGQLKYVVDGSEQCWGEVERATNAYREAGVNWDVWIMPVGSTMEQQQENQEAICVETVERGYNFCARVHSWVFGNKVGT